MKCEQLSSGIGFERKLFLTSGFEIHVNDNTDDVFLIRFYSKSNDSGFKEYSYNLPLDFNFSDSEDMITSKIGKDKLRSKIDNDISKWETEKYFIIVKRNLHEIDYISFELKKIKKM